MKKLCMVTYIREDEEFTNDLVQIGNALHNNYLNFNCIVYFEKDLCTLPRVDFSIEQRLMIGTKYKKFLNILNNSEDDYIISIDNDIKANINNLLKLVDKTLNLKKVDISWGKIYARSPKKLISKLVDVDKLLSHDSLRPMLWRLNVGITIPGQCFIIKTKAFQNKLIESDTFLDDLALGLYSAKNRLNYLILKDAVAYEVPSASFNDLLNQRKRWATGYRQILFLKELSKMDRILVIIHGLTYYGLFIINSFFVIMLFIINPLYSFLFLLFIALLIARNRPSMIVYSILYQLIFPLFHFQWIKYFLKKI